jgi:hypothetical protein
MPQMTPEQRAYWRGKSVSKRLLGYAPEGVTWGDLSDDEQIALRAFDRHVQNRLTQRRHRPFDDDRVFMTPKYIAALLRKMRYPLHGIHFGRRLRRLLIALGVIEETGQHLNPARQPKSHPEKTFYWPLYRVPVLSSLLSEFRLLRAYDSGHTPSVPKERLSLSSALRCQGLIPKRRPPSGFSEGSVQWVFAGSGPP